MQPFRVAARTAIDPPSRRGDTAYFTLFSTIVCTARRGTWTVRAASGTSMRVPKPAAEAHALDGQIGGDHPQLFFQRDERLGRAVE